MLMLLFYHDIRKKVGQHREPDFLAAYKNQQKVERGFRFFKDPLFMALMMVMTLCLLVYAALEYRMRECLKINKKTFPNQKGKPSSTPTARWIFQYFSGIHLLIIRGTQQLVLNLNEHHLLLLKLLGMRYEKLYSES